jgi:hypothetical protein
MKKSYIIIGVIVLAVYLLMRKKQTSTDMDTTAPQPQPQPQPQAGDIQSAFVTLKNNFGPEFSRKIEQLYRWETGHFESGQFKEGYSPGMVATKTTYPFGWPSLDEYNRANSIDGRRYSVGRTFVVRGKNYRYVKFPDFKTALNFVAWFIRNKRGGMVQKWNSLDPIAYNKYLNDINTITPRFT